MNEEDIISLFYAKSHLETYEVLFPLAQRGDKFATYFIGNMLISPIDQTVETDILGGVSYLKLSAKSGYSPALEFLGNLYAKREQKLEILWNGSKVLIGSDYLMQST